MIKREPQLSAGGEDPRSVQDPYEILRKHQLDSFVSELNAFVGAFRWPPQLLQKKREARLRKLLAAAKSRSPWHAKRLANIDPQQFTEADVKHLPTMTKTDLMANFDEIVTDRAVTLAAAERHLAGLQSDAYFLRTNHVVSSGGSSGVRGTFVYDWDGWINFGLSSARPIALMLSQEPAARANAVAFMDGSAGTSSAAFAQSFAPWLASQFRSFVPLPMSVPLEVTIARLNELQPTSLCGYPTFIHQLSMAAARGRLHIKPVAVLSGGEPLLAEQRTAMMRHLGARVFDFYGCSEASCVGFSCPEGAGLHVCDDTVILEAVKEDGSPTHAGIPSTRTLLTNLFNMALPLIRYELEDSIVRSETRAACKCGSSFQTIASVEGRTDAIFAYGDILVHPVAVCSILGRDATIVEYQVRQTQRGVDIAICASGAFDEGAIAHQVLEALAANGLRDPAVEITRVEKIERTERGKLLRFIPLRSIH